MTTIGAYEAKTHLSRLLDQVATGESVTITKNGKPVARLVPIASLRRPVSEVLAELRARRPLTLGISTRELIEAGRR